jgi:PAS domain S-box-containing protein
MTDIDLALLVEQSPDATIFADRDGIIRSWNAAAGRIFGHDAAEAIGARLDIIIPESLREAHWRGFDHAVATGEMKYPGGAALPTKAVRKDGATIYVELSFGLVRDAIGMTIGAMAQARDITERFERDRATRRRLRELEAAAAETQSGG